MTSPLATSAAAPSPTNVEVHGRQHARLQRREVGQLPLGVLRVRHVIHQHGRLLVGFEGLPIPAYDVVGCHRLDVAELMHQIRAQQHPVGFLEQHARVPPMRQVRRWHEAEPVPSSLKDLVRLQPARRTIREVGDIDHRAELSAHRGGVRGFRQPFVECAAFVDLEVAPADPAKARGIDQRRNRLAHRRKHPAHARMKQQRLVVSEKEVIELKVEGRHVQADSIQVRGDFVDARSHAVSLQAPLGVNIEEVSRHGAPLHGDTRQSPRPDRPFAVALTFALSWGAFVVVVGPGSLVNTNR